MSLVLTGPAVWAQRGWPNLLFRNDQDQRELAPKLDLIPKTHPRIFIRGQKDLDDIRARIRTNPNVGRAYSYVLAYAKTDQYYRNLWVAPLQLQAKVLAYRLEDKDPQIKKHCLAIMDYLVQTRGNSWVWPRMAKGLAMAYDWMYDDLTPDQRKLYGERAVYCAQQCYRSWRHSDFNNHIYLEYGPVLYVGVGLYGDGIDDASTRRMTLDALELLYKHFLPAHDYVNMGDGGWQESMGYHAFFTYEFAQVVELWANATGEDIWKSFSGLDGEAYYQVYNLRPFDKHRVNVADNGDAGAADSQVLAYLPLVSRRRHDGLARAWSDWMVSQMELESKAGEARALDGHKFFPYVLWYDPTVPAVEPESLPLAHVFRGYGWVPMRSSWKDDATFALFVCSPNWYGGHQHCDNNSFVIHKYAPLALDTGSYDTGSGHRGNYYARTIAHNTITVFDPDEKFTGGTWGVSSAEAVSNDGGQVYMTAPQFVSEVGPGSRFDRSRLLAYEVTDQYTYTAGDATKAYSGHKLREFTRAFLHLRPDIFVVFDRVESTRPEFKKRWLLHTQTEPGTDGQTFTVVNGPGKLWGRTLLPQTVQYESVGGEGKEFWVDGKNWPPPKGVKPDTGRWRLEVSPAQPATRDYFLHVLYATASTDQAHPDCSVAQTADSVSVTVKHGGNTWVVRLAKNGPLATSTLRA